MPLSPSPIIQSYMQQGQPREAPLSAEQMFNKSFGEAAFATLRSKFPALINFVVTYKIIDSDVDKGSALGVFIIQTGKDICYIPVAMSGGAINSCELIYNKDADQFSPLSEHNVKRLLSQNMTSDASLLHGNAHVDDTKQLFRDLIRPPASSNVVLASSVDITALPNEAKDMVRTYLNATPDLLCKIAEFYDIEVLAQKLAGQDPVPPVTESPRILDLESITKEAAACLTPEERERLLEDGFLVKKSSNDSPVHVASMDTFQASVETELNLHEYPSLGTEHSHDGLLVRSGEVLQCTSRGFKREAAVFLRAGIFLDAKRWIHSSNAQALVHNMQDVVTEGQLKAAGAMTVKELCTTSVAHFTKIIPVVPARHGGYIQVTACDIACGSSNRNNEPVKFSTVENDTYLIMSSHSPFNEIHVTPNIQYGFLLNGDTAVVPEGTLFFIQDENTREPVEGLVRSFGELRKLIGALGIRLTVTSDGITTGITDSKTEKTASFSSNSSAAEWLAKNYTLGHDQISTVLNNRTSVLFSKQAFDAPAPQTLFSQQQPMPIFDPVNMQDYAALGDPEILDTGILSSFSQDPDIKSLLVDYLPDFITMLDKLGRVILLFCLQKEDLENFYGRDRYANVLGSCRKVFKLIGDTANSLELYINMA